MSTDGQQFAYRVVDLTQPVSPGMPLWPGDPRTERRQYASLERDGFALHGWMIGEHSGTHLGMASHRIAGGATLDALSMEQLVVPLRVVDVRQRKRGEPLGVYVERLREFETIHGQIPRGSCVALLTGWDERWPDPERVFETDAAGNHRWPGFTMKAVRCLAEERRVAMIGSDAPDIGPGDDRELKAGELCARQGMLHLENLAGLEQMPGSGGFVVIGALRLTGGTGSPARVFGLIP